MGDVMTGIPQEVLRRRTCSHCWHDVGEVRGVCSAEYKQRCCWCGETYWRRALGEMTIPGHGTYYPCPWTWGDANAIPKSAG